MPAIKTSDIAYQVKTRADLFPPFVAGIVLSHVPEGVNASPKLLREMLEAALGVLKRYAYKAETKDVLALEGAIERFVKGQDLPT